MQQGTDYSQGHLPATQHSLADLTLHPLFERGQYICPCWCEVYKTKSEENAWRSAASSFVSSSYWEPNLEGWLASQIPFLLVAALDHLSPVRFGTFFKKKEQNFFFLLDYTPQNYYMQ